MIRYIIQDTEYNLKLTHIRFFELVCEILTTINPILTDLFITLQDHGSTMAVIRKFEEEEEVGYANEFTELYDKNSRIFLTYAPTTLFSLIYAEEEITSEDAYNILSFFKEKNILSLIDVDNKELFRKLCSLLEKSVETNKKINVKEE